MTSEGRVWKFGDDVNTDLIIPGRYLDNYDPSHLARHAMEGACKEFASEVRAGDIIIAGHNFGCGSSREQAAIALKTAGTSAVIASSFARIFYRNAVNLGMPVLVSSEAVRVFLDGERVLLDMDNHRLSSVDGTRSTPLEEIPKNVRDILESGGLIPYLKRKAADKQ
ncbi:TPA: 3-isopropylmalate dehydratase small subunit [Thermoplasmata archaeon]|nr:3-isopropylmalate dehydratase small subunit [Thermoplasmata archaeon]